MKKIIVAYNLKVLCVERGGIIQRDLTSVTRRDDILCVAEEGSVSAFAS